MITGIIKYINPKNPLSQFFVFLSFFSLLSTFDLLFFTQKTGVWIQYIANLLLVITSALFLYFLVKKVLGIKYVIPLNFFITAYIIYLLVHPTNSWWFFFLTVAIAWLGKYFIKYKSLPIFNPAGLGIFITYHLFEFLNSLGISDQFLLVSWWGADIKQRFLENQTGASLVLSFALLLLFLYFMKKFKKLPYSLSGFFSYILFSAFFGASQNGTLNSILTFASSSVFSSFAFLFLVMLPEPKTSPDFPKQQIILGTAAGGIFFFLNNYLPLNTSFSIDLPFISTILVLNLLTFLFKKYNLLK